MARINKSFKANDIATLVAAVNAYLAPLIAGDSVNIIWADMVLNYYPRQMDKEFQFNLTLDDVPTAPATTPFTLEMFDARSPTDLDAELATYYAAHVGEFATGARIVSQDQPRTLNQMIVWLLANETLADGGNYTPS